MKLVKGQYAEDRCNYGDAEKSILRATSNAEPLRYLKHCPLYEPTPLHRLDGLARTLGVAGVFAVTRHPELGTEIALDDSSVILLIGTEGATDPQRYHELVGFYPDRVPIECKM